MEVAARDHDPASHNIQADQFPLVEKILQKEISLRNTNGAIHRLDVPSPNTGGEFPTQLRLDSQGTQGMLDGSLSL